MYKLIGIILFWVLWPFWLLHFKLVPTRTRVLIVSGGQLLLVKGWFSAQGRWSLPGGGVHSGEAISSGAVRETKEEVGFTIQASDLRELGDIKHSRYGLRYKAVYFMVELPEKIAPRLRRPELIDAAWIDISSIKFSMLDEDAAHAFENYVSK